MQGALTTPTLDVKAEGPPHGAKEAKAVDPDTNYARPLCSPGSAV